MQGEEVFFRDDADEFVLFGDQYVSYALSCHGKGGFVGEGLGRQGAELGAHDADDGLVEADAGQGDAVEDVVQGEDADRSVVFDGDHGADAEVVQGLQYFPDGGVGAAGDGFAPQDGD